MRASRPSKHVLNSGLSINVINCIIYLFGPLGHLGKDLLLCYPFLLLRVSRENRVTMFNLIPAGKEMASSDM